MSWDAVLRLFDILADVAAALFVIAATGLFYIGWRVLRYLNGEEPL